MTTTYLFSAIIQILCVYSTKLYEACNTKANLEISSKVLLWTWKPSLDHLRYARYYTHHHNRVLLLTCMYFDQWCNSYCRAKLSVQSTQLKLLLSEWKSEWIFFQKSMFPMHCFKLMWNLHDIFSFIYNWWTNFVTLNRRDFSVRILILEQSHLLEEIIDFQNYLTTKNATFSSVVFK